MLAVLETKEKEDKKLLLDLTDPFVSSQLEALASVFLRH